MTDQDWQELGRRAVACRGWRWVPGMLARNRSGYTIRFADEFGSGTYPATYVLDGDILRHCDGATVWHDDSRGAVPDLRDPATLGCLLALVREAKDDQGWQVLCLDDGVWWIESGDHPTEAAALVAALESAP